MPPECPEIRITSALAFATPAAMVPIPDSETNSIVLTVCDSWNQCTTQSHEAGATPGGQEDETVNPPVSDSEGSDDGLAVAGFVIAIIALVIVIIAVVAMVLLGRRK